MTARVITVANQKGGCGKSTITMLLAGSIGSKRKKVLVIGADGQGSAERWVSAAPDDTPFPAAVAGLGASGEKVHREVKKFVDNYDYIFIDCPPAVDSPVPQSALLISDLVLIPAVLSPLDLYALQPFMKMVQNAQDINETLKARLVPNMCQLRTKIAQDVLEIMTDLDIPVAKTNVHQRTVYRQCPAYGAPVSRFGKSAQKAADEIESLTEEVLTLLRSKKHG